MCSPSFAFYILGILPPPHQCSIPGLLVAAIIAPPPRGLPPGSLPRLLLLAVAALLLVATSTTRQPHPFRCLIVACSPLFDIIVLLAPGLPSLSPCSHLALPSIPTTPSSSLPSLMTTPPYSLLALLFLTPSPGRQPSTTLAEPHHRLVSCGLFVIVAHVLRPRPRVVSVCADHTR